MKRFAQAHRLLGRGAPLAIVILLLVALAGGLIAPRGAAARSASYARLDVAMTVQPNGDFRVVETQRVSFSGGPFHLGYRAIPTARTDGITDIQVAEVVNGQAQPYTQSTSGNARTYSVTQRSTEVEIDWTFPTVQTNGERTFLVAYTMKGALRSYPNETPPNQQVWFTPISGDLTSETPVQGSTFTVTLPSVVDTSQVKAEADGKQIDNPAALTKDGKTFTFTHDAFSNGSGWELRLQTPIVAPNAPVPDWQPADDALRANQQAASDRQTLITGLSVLGGLFILVIGGVVLLLLWFTRGRDPHTGLVADFLPTPPDDTPAGVVGVLVDERADERDIVATVMDLGRRGLIQIHNEPGKPITLERTASTAPVADFEAALLRMIFPGPDKGGTQTVALSEVSNLIASSGDYFRDSLYAEVVRRGYFKRSPEATRNRWKTIGSIITSLSILAGIVLSLLVSPWLVFPALIVTLLSLVLRKMAGSMPARTQEGADAAAKWRAFERYLKDLDKYDQVDTAKKNFETYLPYAIAFGLESSWVQRFQRANVPVPGWFSLGDVGDVGDVVMTSPGGPYPRTYRRGGGGWGGPIIIGDLGGGSRGGGNGQGGGVDLPDVKIPSLQDVSNKSARGLQSGSSGLSDVLNVLGAIIEVASIFSGGGGKGGSSGGGRGGFS